MIKVFKQTIMFATLLAAGIFAVRFLLSLADIFLSFATSLAPLGNLIPGSSHGFLSMRGGLQFLSLVALVLIMIFLTKIFGAAVLKQSTLKGTVSTTAKAPLKAVGNTAKGGLNFMSGLRHLNQDDLRRFAMRRSLMGGGRGSGGLINKGIRAKDDLAAMKSVAEKGKDGRIKKKNLKELKKQGITAKDSREGANDLIGKKKEAALANVGVNKDSYDKLNNNDKKAVDNLINRDDMSLADKRDAVKKIHADNIKDRAEKQGLNVSDADIEKFTDRKQKAALAHGQELDNHIRESEEWIKKNDVVVFDDEGREISAKDYIEANDNKAIATSDKFRESHKETLGHYGAKGIAGVATAMYALDISRTNEENRNSTLSGSLNPAYAQPVASSEERETDHAARVHGRMPIDEDVAEKHAEKAQKHMNEVNSSETGYRSTGEEPIASDKTVRDTKGQAMSSFISDQDDFVHAAEVLNTGSPHGNILPLSLTEDFDPEKMTEENIANATQGNVNTYASGAFRPDVVSGAMADGDTSATPDVVQDKNLSSDDVENAFAAQPLSAGNIYGYQGNMDMAENLQQAVTLSSDSSDSSDSVDDVFAGESSSSAAIDNAFAGEAYTGSRTSYSAANQSLRDDTIQQQKMEQVQQQQQAQSEGQQRMQDYYEQIQQQNQQEQQQAQQDAQQQASQQSFDDIDKAFTAYEPSPQVGQQFRDSFSDGNKEEMTQSVNQMARDIGRSHNVDLDISQSSQEKLGQMVNDYQTALNNGSINSIDNAQSKIDDIAKFAAGSISGAAFKGTQSSAQASKDADQRIASARNSLNDSLTDMLNEISKETMNRKAEAEEEERRRRGTEGIKDTGNTGRQSR